VDLKKFLKPTKAKLLLAALLYLLFGIQVYIGDLSDFLMYGLPHIVGALMSLLSLLAAVPGISITHGVPA
jgi:hypothetical protein